ncbi:MAG TPA: hypothetical protein VGS41_14785 [Chthonomonadales bacterium]|nr:hypothetical protein [Chthonomonadales bacterium]
MLCDMRMIESRRRATIGLRNTSRRPAPCLLFLFVSWLLLASPAILAQGPASVLTYHNDNSRTGQNLNETSLTPANVNVNSFGRLFWQPLDGLVCAQILYVPGLRIPGKGVHNAIFICTEHDSVYAADADSGSGANGHPLWHFNCTNPATGVTTIPASDTPAPNFPGGEYGITSTPVIDPSTGTIYLVAMTKEVSGAGTSYVARLHALDITTGQEKFGGPVVIQATVPGTGDDTDGDGNVYFVPLHHLNRLGLLLTNGTLYIGWGSHNDIRPYHGWLMAYNAATLQQIGVLCLTPNGYEGSLWQAGAAPAADANGNVFVAGANGSFDYSLGGADIGSSVLKLNTSSGIQIADYFTPFNNQYLSNVDLDLGGGGVMLLPASAGSAQHPDLLVAAGKEGRIYLLDQNNLGGMNLLGDTQVVQEIPFAMPWEQLGAGEFGSPAFFKNTIYYHAAQGYLEALPITNAKLATTPSSVASTWFGYPGSSPVISANGAANGIVWAVQSNDPYNGNVVLHAYDASNLTNELYNSNQAGPRDWAGSLVDFPSATVANGKVYVAAYRRLSVYGLGSFATTAYMTMKPETVLGGGHATGTIVLSAPAPKGGATFTLSSSLPTAKLATPSVTIPAGKTVGTFTVNTVPAPQMRFPLIKARFGTVSALAELTVRATGVASLTLASPTVVGGRTISGIATLEQAAPAGGTTVLLATSDMDAADPTTHKITVPAGSTTAAFNITARYLPAPVSLSILAQASNVGVSAPLTVEPIGVRKLTFSPNPVTGSLSTTGRVTLQAPAAPGAITVNLFSANPALAQPDTGSITIPAGSSSGTFTVSSVAVASSTKVPITAATAGAGSTSNLHLLPNGPQSVSFSSNPVTGGYLDTATVTIAAPAPTGGLTVALTTSSSTIAAVPSGITVPAGQTSATFTVTTSEVQSPASATITAAANGIQAASVLAVQALTVSSVTLSANPVVGGSSLTGTVTLSAAAPPGGQAVSLSSSSTLTATVPASVNVPAGSLSGSFPITAFQVSAQTNVTITAATNGSQQTATLTVQTISVYGLSLTPNPVAGGNKVTGTVTLSGAAPAGGQVVDLSTTSSSTAAPPPSITVAAGATSAQFTITTSPVQTTANVVITAATNGSQQTATLTVQAATILTFTIAPATEVGGQSAVGTITLTGPAPAGGLSISLAVSPASAQQYVFVNGTGVTVPPGSTTVTFPILTKPVTAPVMATITASANGSSVSAQLTVKP